MVSKALSTRLALALLALFATILAGCGKPNIERLSANQDIEGLTTALIDGDATTRVAAIQALEQIGNREAVDALVSAITLDDEAMRGAASLALVRIGAPAVPSLVAQLSNDGMRAEASAMLAQIGVPAITPLIETLEGGANKERAAARETLLQIGAPAAKPLVGVLKHQDPDVRESASQALLAIGTPAIDPLIAGLSNQETRVEAARILTKLGEPAIEPLVRALADNQLRTSSAEVLTQMGAPAVTPLIQAAQSDDIGVRTAVSQALVGIGVPAVQPLVRILKNEDVAMQTFAAQTLAEIGAPAVQSLVRLVRGDDQEATESARDFAARSLVQIGSPAVPWLASTLTSENPEQVRTAAALLGQIGDVSAVDELRAVIGRTYLGNTSETREQFEAAIQALAQIGAPAVDALVLDLSSQDRSISASAGFALEHLGSASVAPLVAALGNTSNTQTRVIAIGVLEEIKDQGAIGPLAVALRDEDEQVRTAAAEALKEFGDQHAAEILVEALQDKDQRVRRTAVEALGAAFRWDEALEVHNAAYAALHAMNGIKAVESVSEIFRQSGGEPASHLLEVLFLDDPRPAAMAPICQGQTASGSDYDPSTEGPHPVVLVDYYDVFYGLPGNWRPPLDNPLATQLVVCFGDVERTLIETCPYTGGPDIARYRLDEQVTLHEASSGKVVASTTLSGTPPRECLKNEAIELTELVGDSPPYPDTEMMETWLQPYVE